MAKWIHIFSIYNNHLSRVLCEMLPHVV